MTVTVGGIAYVLAVSALLALATRAAEAALRPGRRPLRWVWTAGLAATAAAPLAPRLLPHLAGTGGSAPGDIAVRTDALAGGASAVPPAGAVRDAFGALAEALATPVPDGLAAGLGAAWAAASLVLLASLIGGWIRLRRRCRAWPEERAAGEAVRVSRGTGPAAAGVLRPVVVVPAWLLRRGGRDLEMAVLHEREHARARDPALLAAGRALAALVPWNPFLWWQLRRLRLAVELDCDRRVLDHGLPRRGYGRLLLEVSASPSGGLLRPAATLGERSTHLEERIRAMTSEPVPRPSVLRSVLLVGLALGLVAGACETPVPPSPADAPAAAADRAAGGESGEASDARDLDREPEIADRRDVTRALARGYPPALRDEGVGGAVSLRLRVGPDGTVDRARVTESSGHRELDVAARDALASVEFEPATRDGDPVAAWVTQRVTFALQPGDGADVPDAEPAGEDRAASLSALRIAVDGGAPGGAEAGGSTFRIRGNAPLDPDDMPLIYIDGTPAPEAGDGSTASRLDEIDPDEIQSIRVLKGEAAVAAYGEEAVSGVLLIETKGGARSSG